MPCLRVAAPCSRGGTKGTKRQISLMRCTGTCCPTLLLGSRIPSADSWVWARRNTGKPPSPASAGLWMPRASRRWRISPETPRRSAKNTPAVARPNARRSRIRRRWRIFGRSSGFIWMKARRLVRPVICFHSSRGNSLTVSRRKRAGAREKQRRNLSFPLRPRPLAEKSLPQSIRRKDMICSWFVLKTG